MYVYVLLQRDSNYADNSMSVVDPSCLPPPFQCPKSMHQSNQDDQHLVLSARSSRLNALDVVHYNNQAPFLKKKREREKKRKVKGRKRIRMRILKKM